MKCAWKWHDRIKKTDTIPAISINTPGNHYHSNISISIQSTLDEDRIRLKTYQVGAKQDYTVWTKIKSHTLQIWIKSHRVNSRQFVQFPLLYYWVLEISADDIQLCVFEKMGLKTKNRHRPNFVFTVSTVDCRYGNLSFRRIRQSWQLAFCQLCRHSVTHDTAGSHTDNLRCHRIR